MWLASYFAGLLLIVFLHSKQKRGVPWREVFFPRQTYGHASARDDVWVMLTGLALGALATARAVAIQGSVAAAVSSLIIYLSPPMESRPFSPLPVWGYALAVALVLDFATFYAHRLTHKVDWLWSFHKVHHSAAVLTPLTQNRFHPVDDIFLELFSGLVFGLFLGVGSISGFVAGYQGDFENLWIVYLVFNLTSHFRHSHIWISFGPYLSLIFSSPAMHQLHHSCEARHTNKNFAPVFSFWDWLFGSLYIPREREQFRIGLNELRDQSRYQGFFGLMISPFREIAERLPLTSSVTSIETKMTLPPEQEPPPPSRC